jgi:hypothetical protein
MSIHETTTAVDARQAESEIADGRLTMSAVSDLRDSDDLSVYVTTPDETPLGAQSEHARLRIVGDGFECSVGFDSEQVVDLVAALEGAEA